MARTAVAALALLVLTWSSPASAGSPRPTIRVLDRQPVKIRGTGFRRHERIRVTVAGRASHTRVVRSSAAGAFTVTFDGVSFALDRCGNGWSITARGARGDTAALELPQPECPPQLGP